MNKDNLKKAICYMTLYVFSGCLYVLIEYLYRGRSDICMFILAGFVGLFIALLNNTLFEFDTDYLVQVIAATVYCIWCEWMCGLCINMDYSIWDYRNVWGALPWTHYQVCIPFCFAWFFICMWGLPLMDVLQYKMGIAERPYYRFKLINNKKYYIVK
jgi:hypothetical protein